LGATLTLATCSRTAGTPKAPDAINPEGENRVEASFEEEAPPAQDSGVTTPGADLSITEPTEPPALPQSPIVPIDLDAIPPVDLSWHSVPLGEIYFDTFRRMNRAVPLDVADPSLIRSLLDAIPPIYQPRFESVDSADTWLRDTDLVLGYAAEDEAYAYPINILNFHEIVLHTVGDVPVLASYCPLCRSGIVYDSRVRGELLLFGNTSALYQSDMVMVDHATGSYWMQVSGEAIVGPMTGERLKPLPSQTTSWGLWKQQYPHTVSLSRDTGYRRDYRVNPFDSMGSQLNATGRFAFPVSERGRDPRLRPGEIVLGLESGSVEVAYPISRLGDGVINDVVGDTPVTIFSLAEGPTGAAYSSYAGEEALTFVFESGSIKDRETGSTWSFGGVATAGQLKGSHLEALPSRSTFWFALIAAFPDLELHALDN
jgi:hypothetical protein